MFQGSMENAISSKASDDECNVRPCANLKVGLNCGWYFLISRLQATYQCLCDIEWYFA